MALNTHVTLCYRPISVTTVHNPRQHDNNHERRCMTTGSLELPEWQSTARTDQHVELTLPTHDDEAMHDLPSHGNPTSAVDAQSPPVDIPSMLAVIESRAWQGVLDAAQTGTLPVVHDVQATEWLEYMPMPDRASLATTFQNEIYTLELWAQATTKHGMDSRAAHLAREQATKASNLKYEALSSAMGTARSIMFACVAEADEIA